MFTGDVVAFMAKTVKRGTSSVTVRIRVLAERYATGDEVFVTEACMTMVSVNAAGQPIPFDSDPTVGASVREKPRNEPK